MNNLQAKIITNFRGIRSLSPDLLIPRGDIEEGYMIACENLLISRGQLYARPGYSSLDNIDMSGGVPTVVYFLPYVANGVQHYVAILSTRTVVSTQMPGIALGTSFTSTLFNKLYINNPSVAIPDVFYTTMIDGIAGQATGGIFVSNSASGRQAAGGPPVVAPVVATGAAGKIEVGLHLIGVCFETESGFITKYGPLAQYTAPGAAQANLTGIPVGPVGTIARRIVATKVVRNFNGDTLQYKQFFVPGGRIADNVTTVLTIDFYDSELLEDASYLNDILSAIPHGLGMCTYRGRMIVYGTRGTVSTVPSSTVLVSESANFEAFSAVDGFIQVNPQDGDGVVLAFELNGLLYFCKKNSIWVTRDNGGPPNTWKVDKVDGTIGALGPFGLGIIDGDSQQNILNNGVLLLHRTGLYFFNGQYDPVPLTYNISGSLAPFLTATNLQYGNISVSVDTLNKNIYITCDDGIVSCGNYEEGLSWDKMKWTAISIKNRNAKCFHALKSAVTSPPNTYFAAFIGSSIPTPNIFRLNPKYRSDDGTALTWSFTTEPWVPEEFKRVTTNSVRLVISPSSKTLKPIITIAIADILALNNLVSVDRELPVYVPGVTFGRILTQGISLNASGPIIKILSNGNEETPNLTNGFTSIGALIVFGNEIEENGPTQVVR